MSPSEIIANQAAKGGHDPAAVMATVKKYMEDGNSVLLREGDSVFLVTRIGGNAVEIVMFTADGAMNLPNIVTAALKKIQASGAKIIYGDKEDAMLLDVLQKIGAPVQPENSDGHSWSVRI
jgi:hypothetical protein